MGTSSGTKEQGGELDSFYESRRSGLDRRQTASLLLVLLLRERLQEPKNKSENWTHFMKVEDQVQLAHLQEEAMSIRE
jgi:hypothetical protein